MSIIITFGVEKNLNVHIFGAQTNCGQVASGRKYSVGGRWLVAGGLSVGGRWKSVVVVGKCHNCLGAVSKTGTAVSKAE